MFGHLRSHEYTDRIEGIALCPQSEKHLAMCVRCREELQAVGNVRRLVDALIHAQDFQPEPDWQAFRAGVRDRLLSRSVRRQRLGWTGWISRPIPAWTIAVFAAVGFAAAIYVGGPATEPQTPVSREIEAESESANNGINKDLSIEDVRSLWSNVSAFNEVSELAPEESERLNELLEDETRLSQSRPWWVSVP